jgi:hypothetical protein
MATWDDRRQVLARLHEERPGILMVSPDLSGGEAGGPPYQIYLAPWAQDAAGELWRRFGDQLVSPGRRAAVPPGEPAGQ